MTPDTWVKLAGAADGDVPYVVVVRRLTVMPNESSSIARRVGILLLGRVEAAVHFAQLGERDAGVDHHRRLELVVTEQLADVADSGTARSSIKVATLCRRR
jgi:hypothetical protein